MIKSIEALVDFQRQVFNAIGFGWKEIVLFKESS